MNVNKQPGLWSAIPVLLATVLVLDGCGQAASPAKLDSDFPYEVVSINWVASQTSNSAANQTAYWNENQPKTGLMLVLKLKGHEPVEHYSSDFSLGFIDEQGIPRSACMGLCMGVADASQIKQATWMLGGSMSRAWADSEKPYFALLFTVPRTVSRVTLYGASPIMKDLNAMVAGAGR